jgi:S-formylglutathione hydrolase FrmB
VEAGGGVLVGVSLVSGWLWWLLLMLGFAGAVLLLSRRERWWWAVVVPVVVVISVVAAWVIGGPVATSLFVEPLPPVVAGWIGVAVAGIGLAVGSLWRVGWARRVGAVLGAVLVVTLAASQVNIFYVQYPTLGDVLGVTSDQEITGPPPLGRGDSPPLVSPTAPLAAGWVPTGPNIPADGKGRVSQIDLPGTRSGFPARPGWVYYPPAYFADNAVPLPVLVLLAGQPGEPHDWFLGDRLPSVMNGFAAQHRGIAPVVVVPDALGSQLANPICVDSNLGRVDTYLSLDVPDTIRAQLRVDPNARHWVVGGFSYGGTCSIQMTTNHPSVYPNFVDIAGQLEPTLGSRQQTVTAAFGGDEAKFKAINPIDLMASAKFPANSGWFIVGSQDTGDKSQQQQVFTAAQAAGMDVQLFEVPGSGHDWNTCVAGLTHVMPWMGHQMNITG